MDVEKSRLKLMPQPPARIPTEFRTFYLQIREGFSLYQIAQGLKGSNEAKRFASLARFVVFLHDEGLLMDRSAKKLAESLRSDYQWPTAPVATKLITLKLFALAARPVQRSLSFFILLILLIVGLWGVRNLLSSSIFDYASMAAGDPAQWLMSFFLVLGAGRSLHAVALFMTTYLTAGHATSATVNLRPTGIDFSSDQLSLTRGSDLTLWSGFAAILWLTLPSALFRQSEFHGSVGAMTLLLLLIELSPFVQSAATDWLRMFYNMLSRENQRDQSVESSTRVLHLASGAIWFCGFAAFVAKIYVPIFVSLRAQDLSISSASGLAGLVFLAGFTISLLFIFADAIGGVFFAGGLDLATVRRIWRRKGPSLSVDEAIAQGRMPTRSELSQLPLFRQLHSDLRKDLLARGEVLSVDEGARICSEGQSDRKLFTLLSGQVAVARTIRGRRRVVALLSSGSIFGEAAFFLGQKRTADIIATEKSLIFSIEHHPDMKQLDQDRSEELKTRIWFLQALVSGTYFRDLPSEAFDALIFAGRERRLPVGSHVTREGQDGEACYFIIQGQATVTQNGKVINKLKAGDVFGEIALLHPLTPRTATVTADSDLLTIAVTSDDFWDLLASHLPLAVEIERVAEKRLQADRHR
jgi:CRP-like cAMP-binding protein